MISALVTTLLIVAGVIIGILIAIGTFMWYMRNWKLFS